MSIADILTGPQAKSIIAAIAKAIGLNPEQVQAVITAVLPLLVQRVERNTWSRGGIADLIRVLGEGQRQNYLSKPELIGSPQMIADGNAILGEILGGREQSRSLASRAAATSGVSADLIRQLLPIIAALLMGALSKGSQGGLGDILRRLPGGLPGGMGGSDAPASGGGNRDLGDIGDILKKIPGLPGAQAPQGRPQSAPVSVEPRKSAGGSPLPLPGDTIPGIDDGPRNNPYGDLSDIIRRSAPSASPGPGPLGNIVRDILGSALGFDTKGGFLSWIIRLIVMRWGWGFIRSILGGLLMRR